VTTSSEPWRPRGPKAAARPREERGERRKEKNSPDSLLSTFSDLLSNPRKAGVCGSKLDMEVQQMRRKQRPPIKGQLSFWKEKLQ
jgi:hypothetical protein